jgi:TonB family protein
MDDFPIMSLARVVAVICCLASCCFSPAQSTPDLSQVQAKAEAGDAKAQTQIGLALASGDGVSPDEARAVEWFRKAANQGDAAGEYYLGEMCFSGRGIEKDEKEAAVWLQKAADQHEPRALFNLGGMYLNGAGVKKNEKRAFELTRQAAEQGLAAGQFGLGSMYANGLGVTRDLQEAARWYTKAIEQGDAPAMNNLAWLRMNSSDLSLRDSTEALSLAERAVGASHEETPAYLDTLAWAFYWNQRYEDAASAERKALSLRSGDRSYSQNLANFEALAQSEQKSPNQPSANQIFGPQSGATMPTAVSTPPPAGPLEKGEGVVVLFVVVGSNGRVLQAKVAKGVSPDSDRKAIDAVRQWVFKPAMKDGKPVAVQINVEVSFRAH